MLFLEIRRQLIEARNTGYSYSYCLHLIDFFVEDLATNFYGDDKDGRFILFFYYLILMYRCGKNLRQTPGILGQEFKFTRNAILESERVAPRSKEKFFSRTIAYYKDVEIQTFYLEHSKNTYIMYDQNLFKFDLKHYGLDEHYLNRFISWYVDRRANNVRQNTEVIDI